MKQMACVSFAALGLLLVVCRNILAQDKNGKGLFADGDERILLYLHEHPVPSIPAGGFPPSTGDPRRVDTELRRAHDLFSTGSPRLRLAIVKALCDSQKGLEFWDECGPGDYEARHYLIGLALSVAEGEKKRRLLDWLRQEAHPSYATALLRNLRYFNLYGEEQRKDELNRFLPLIRGLYRQTGVVVLQNRKPEALPGNMVGSVQAFTVRLIPPTAEGRELLLDWVMSDSKKVAPKTLEQMWQTWDIIRRHFENAQTDRDDSREDALMERASKSLAVAEAWLLSPEKVIFSTVPDYRDAFRSNVWRQVFNPDPRVRKNAVRRVLLTSHGRDALEFIRDQPAPAPLREQAAEDAKDLSAELSKSAETQEQAERVKVRYRELLEALAAR